MTEAVSFYEEKPRDQWLFDFPAQVALCGTQIWWTTEVNIAFGRLEEGYENALKDYNKKQVWDRFLATQGSHKLWKSWKTLKKIACMEKSWNLKEKTPE